MSRTGNDATETTSTDRSPALRSSSAPCFGLAVVLVCDDPTIGGALFPLTLGQRVVVGRGARPEPSSSVGRGATRVDLPDAKASRDHAVFEARDGRVRVADLGSTNGTYVDEVSVREHTISPGELIRVGHTFLRVTDNAAPALDRIARGTSWPFSTLTSDLALRFERLERIASSPLPILLTGETGTGKERVAQAIHQRSGRPGAFVPVNCGALPAGLVESQLFGHKKGAFSGATSDAVGFVRAAHEGTLFLDEVGDLPLLAQAALLRVLQEGEVNPLGAAQATRVDLRIVCATHHPLPAMVAQRTFREDLFARLAAFSFTLPPLCDRLDDLGLLVASILAGKARAGAPSLRFDTDAAYAMLRHGWPRNVRELVHTVQTAALLADAGHVRAADLSLGPDRPQAAGEAASATTRSSAPPAALDAADLALRDELRRRLAERDGNLAAVGRDMGKARQQIQRWKKRLGLP